MPEKNLTVSPQLAATIGLEEALLYQLLGELHLLKSPDADFLSVDPQHLMSLTPFWNETDLRRVLNNLRDKGVLHFSSPFGVSAEFACSLASAGMPPSGRTSPATTTMPRGTAASPMTTEPSNTPRTRIMNMSWQPARDIVAQLGQYGIPEQFIEEQIPEFVTYWSERGDPMHSWNAKFLKNTLRQWRDEQTREAKRSRESVMVSGWQPSRDAIELLIRQSGINRNFIEDAIPEFILYWRERGTRRSTWNTDFVRHVKNQWARFTATLEHDSEPRVIGRDWSPNEDLFEVLQLANIPREFAEREVPEFILYWRESGQAISSWNTKFLQHVKRQWAKHCATGDNNHERHQGSGAKLSTRDRSLVEDLTDRSWAN